MGIWPCTIIFTFSFLTSRYMNRNAQIQVYKGNFMSINHMRCTSKDSECERVCVCQDSLSGMLQHGYQEVATFLTIIPGDISLAYN